MERLTTRRRDDGRWALRNDDGANIKEQINKIPRAIDRLAAYEDTGLEPEEIESIKSLCLGGKHYVLGFLPPTNAPLTLEELREMANRKVPARFTPGDTVWVVERDENGNVFEVSGYMFLAAVDYFAVVSAFINDVENLDETMALLADDTAENDNTDLCVFPLADVYGTQEAAHAALDAEEAAAGGVSNVSNLDTKEDVP